MNTAVTKHTYKDFETRKKRWTRGKFVGWQRGGPLNVQYAVFQNRRGAVLVPEYCLTSETRKALAGCTGETEASAAQNGRGDEAPLGDCR
jgi:hypothetical protein